MRMVLGTLWWPAGSSSRPAAATPRRAPACDRIPGGVDPTVGIPLNSHYAWPQLPGGP